MKLEFNEKLQELRKSRGMTQEELSAKLFVSRTAVSKWESGKGYPNIDSLKAIAKFFSVTVDDLLSSDELITAAKSENKANMQKIYRFVFGTADIMTILLMLLPLYPHVTDSCVLSVTLWEYSQAALWIKTLHWVLFAVLTVLGIINIMLTHTNTEKGKNAVIVISLIISIVTVLFLTMTREPYAVTMIFLLLIIKGNIASGVLSHSEK